MKFNYLIVSGHSGAGKNSVFSELKKLNKKFERVVTATTREKRNYEKNGKDYFFLQESEFKKLIGNKVFLEWEKVHGFYYGTPKKSVEKILKKSNVPVFIVDTKGAKNLKSKLNKIFLVFLTVSKLGELRERIVGRSKVDEKELAVRLKNAKKELGEAGFYDLVLFNDKGMAQKCANKILEKFANDGI